ncbi:MAG TPA: 7TM diverse intracellular signaling domain-containing protein [Ramlibacter sp.]|nr:7TM diverse intracellular signaling domain-containing protein [Ramlibacter sp.]
MTAHELAIWSMALGAVAAVALARLADLIVRPSLSQLQGLAYHGTVFLLVLILSGVAAQLWPRVESRLLQFAQVLAGPVCVGLSNFWIRGWLNAAQRDRVMACALRASAVLLPLAGLACLALPEQQQIPAAGAIALLGGTLTLWLTVRAWLMGDRLAPVMATGCLLTLPAIGGMYAIAMHLPGIGVPLHAAFALCAALCNALTGFVLWRRDRHEWRARREGVMPSQLDPVTKLYSGISLVRKLVNAQRRRGRTRRDGAVLAILVFDVERIAALAGTAGVNEMFICIASRIQRQVGVINPVGRYYDRCFVSLVETIQSPPWLRTLGLRVATSLRRPIEVTGPSGERIELKADVGVGVVHLSRGPAAVEDILHDAQRIAEAARGMRSRAAMLDPATGEVVPVEHANLGPRRHGHAHLVPHAL